MKVNDREFKKKVWKRFWKLKWDESKEYLVTFFIVYGLFAQIGWGVYYDDALGYAWGRSIAISGLFALSIVFVIVLIIVIKLFLLWLIDNWELATEEIKREYSIK